MTKLSECALSTTATCQINLARLIVCKVFDFHVVYGAKVLYFVPLLKVYKQARIKLSHLRVVCFNLRCLLAVANHRVFFVIAN